jgi:uncharacterized protein
MLCVPRLLYLHGFASSGGGRKVSALREVLEPEGWTVEAPDLNAPSFAALDFETMVRRARESALLAPPDVLLGSSLGALVALETARRGSQAPLVLVAPALGFGRRWVEKLPPGDPVLFFHHAEGRELPIHRAFFEQMTLLECDREPPEVPVTILMGRRDESVPYQGVWDVWSRWQATGRLRTTSSFIEIAEGDHSLVEFVPLIADAVRKAVAKKP